MSDEVIKCAWCDDSVMELSVYQGGLVPCPAYLCPKCGEWILTTAQMNEYRRLARESQDAAR